LILALCVTLPACGADADLTFGEDGAATISGAIEVPSRDTPALDVATWNVFWFGLKGTGPSDPAVQLANVRDVMRGTDVDLWSLVEVADADAFAALTRQLPGFEGLLASDARVIHS